MTQQISFQKTNEQTLLRGRIIEEVGMWGFCDYSVLWQREVVMLGVQLTNVPFGFVGVKFHELGWLALQRWALISIGYFMVI